MSPTWPTWARLYLLTHRGNPGDVWFYVGECAGGRRVLELGCGGGRLLGRLANAGLEVVGLDIEPSMLSEARAALHATDLERVSLRHGDMRDFTLPGRFDRVIIPYNGLFALGGEDGMLACFQAVARHLTTGGRLLFDVYVSSPEEEWTGDIEAEPFERLCSTHDGGFRIEISERPEPGPGPWSAIMRYRYDVFAPDGTHHRVERPLLHHFAAPERIEAGLEQAGLRVLHKFGDFHRSPFLPHHEHLVVCAG